ncbi:hypothetical protein [Pedobacter yulinensis]|nr:hypothetical protein [Pedobacter yulinensis]
MTVFVLAVLVFSCKKSAETEADVMLDANLLKSKGQYNELLTKRESGAATFSIENISRTNTTLSVHVKGGCAEQQFKLVWDGSIMESQPARIRLVLINEGGRNCNPEQETTVNVDLKKIIGAQPVSNFVFHVANGSSKQDKSIDPDGAVHSR